MIIHAMSRRRVARLRPNPSCALISISTPGKSYPAGPCLEGWADVLALQFHDVAGDRDPDDWLDQYVRFESADARRVVEFARAAFARGVADLIIHCDAGLSRSVGIAESLRVAALGTLRLWECVAPLQANQRVRSYMLEQLGIQSAGLAESPFWDQ